VRYWGTGALLGNWCVIGELVRYWGTGALLGNWCVIGELVRYLSSMARRQGEIFLPVRFVIFCMLFGTNSKLVPNNIHQATHLHHQGLQKSI